LNFLDGFSKNNQNIPFNEKPSIGSRFVQCRQTNRHDEEIENKPKSHDVILTLLKGVVAVVAVAVAAAAAAVVVVVVVVGVLSSRK